MEEDINKPENTLDCATIIEEEALSMTTTKELELAGIGFKEKANREQLSDDNKAEVLLIAIMRKDENRGRDAVIKQEKV